MFYPRVALNGLSYMLLKRGLRCTIVQNRGSGPYRLYCGNYYVMAKNRLLIGGIVATQEYYEVTRKGTGDVECRIGLIYPSLVADLLDALVNGTKPKVNWIQEGF